jgi:glycosyltransferase involved in cell wall biosynthesis
MHIVIVGPIATADILHLLDGETSNLPVGYSGAPLLVTLIAELLRRGHQVTAVTLSWGMPLDWRKSVRARGNNLEMVYVPMRRRAWQPNGWRLGRIVDLYAFERRGLQYAIEQAAPDVVHAHWSYEFAWAAQRTGLPTLITCHDSPFLVARMYSQSSPTRSLYRWLRAGMAWHVLRHASHVTAVSPYMEAQAQPLCKCSVSVVPNPLPLSLGDHPVDPFRQPDPHFPVLAMVANGWDKRKNPQPALKAFARLRMRKPGARLKMYGADFGPGERAEQWARQNGIAEGMEFIGRVPYGQLLDGLAAADVLVHSSLEESFGMSIAEAMALGVPVIGGAHSGAVPWVVGEGGILTDVTSATAIEQAMLELLDSPERYRAATLAARARAHTHFMADKVADAYETFYRQLAGVVARKDLPSTTQSITRLENRG